MAKNNGKEPCDMVPEELASVLGSDITRGHTTAKAAERLQSEGPNELEKPPKPTLLMLFIMQLTGFVIVLLIIAACASIVVNATGPQAADPLSYTTGVAIFIIVLINAGIAAWTEAKAGDALEALSKMTQASIYVVRDGVEVKVDVPCVVRGDLVVLGTGDVVPADMRLIEADDIKVSEMALTGEPDDVAKTFKIKPKKEGEPEKLTPENCVFSGCSVTNGKGKGFVTDIGMQTRIGRIAQLIAGEDGGKGKTKCFCLPDTSGSATPLQQNLEKLGGRIGVLAIVVCVAIFIIGVAMDRTDPSNPDSPAWLYMILIAVTLAVAAIPEGIPLCVTISLSIGCSEMVTKNVLVRKLAAVETLGSASVICSDKTGTLTEGKMRAVKMWAGGANYDISGTGFDPTKGKVTRSQGGADGGKDAAVHSTLLAALLCSNAKVLRERGADGQDKWVPSGNSSEVPLVVAAQKVGIQPGDAQEAFPRLLEVPFSSSRKMMLTVCKTGGKRSLGSGGITLHDGTEVITCVKGAPNYVIDVCSKWVGRDGSVQPYTAAQKAETEKTIDAISSQALRVLAIAVRPQAKLPFRPDDEEVSADDKMGRLCQELTFLGLVASIDPARAGVREAVQAARDGHIRVMMITGDYLKTAAAIARDIGILQTGESDDSAVDCTQLRPKGDYLSAQKIDAITADARVFARAKPEDKLMIVQSLQRQGHVAAMTGDGVNDAPALNAADIGVAMGIQGTEVAKGASDMILTDDNFCSIVAAVEKGRVIYAGIQKFVAFIMSVHIAEVMQIFFCIVCGIPVMRTPLQILFLILVTDLPPSIALGMEPGEAGILKERPRPREEPVVLDWMWLSMVLNGAVLSAVIIVVYILSLMYYCDGKVFQADIAQLDDYNNKLMDARTVAFISLVWSENVRSYTSRSFDKPVWNNVLGNVNMQKAIILAQICLYAAVLIPGFSDSILQLRGVAVGAQGWLLALLGPLGTLVLCEACKLITAYQVREYQGGLANRHAEEDRQMLAAAETQKQRHMSGQLGAAGKKMSGNALAPDTLGKRASGFDALVVKDPSGKRSKRRGLFSSMCSCFGVPTGVKYDA
mmetsp:Transcript_19825/g.50693  ORF Transcript_19825/g.50693 Transcript_19825/m.50693 type:complete len:1086 (+) Transcript_19825:111-3368(+)